MGRPPSNGGPSFRFNPNEVAEMEGILQAHNCLVPQREILVALADKFSNSAERSGRPAVQMKQVWNWFQNRRYALRAKSAKPPVKLNVSPMPQHDSAAARNVSQHPQIPSVPAANMRNVSQVPQPVPTPTVQSSSRNGTDNSQMEFEAKSARDGAWYDVATFLSHRSLEANDPEVMVRFAGFGPEEDEWVNVRKHVRQRSLPCESSECVAVLPGDLILCFQEGKEQALYFDAHVLDAQRRRHDVRGCRCRFLVRYDHDQSEEIVPLRKVCRRPETDYRMQQLHADNADVKQNKTGLEHKSNSIKAYPAAEVAKQSKVDAPAETLPKPANADVPVDSGPCLVPVSPANISVTTSVAPTRHSIEPVASATIPSHHSNVSVAPSLALDPNSRVPETTISAAVVSGLPVTPIAAPIANSGDLRTTIVATVASNVHVAPAANSSVSGATVVAPTASNFHEATAGAPLADSSVSTVPIAPSAANSSVPIAPSAALPEATVVDPIASNIHVAPATSPVANSSAPTVPTTAPAAIVVDPIVSNIHVGPATSPVANASAPIVPTTVPTADASVSGSESTALVNSSSSTVAIMAATTNSSIPITPTTSMPDTNSSIPVVPIMAPAASPSVPMAPDVALAANPSAPTASNAEKPISNSSVPTASGAEAPVTDPSAPSASSAEALAANSSSPVAFDTEAPATNSSSPMASGTEAPVTNSSSPMVSGTEAPDTNSTSPMASGTEAPATNSSAPTASSADSEVANSSVATASNAEAPSDANSCVSIAMTIEAPFAGNSSILGATGASDVPPVTEVNVSEFGSADNVEMTNAQSSNVAIASGTDTSAVSEEGTGGERMHQE